MAASPGSGGFPTELSNLAMMQAWAGDDFSSPSTEDITRGRSWQRNTHLQTEHSIWEMGQKKEEFKASLGWETVSNKHIRKQQ